MEPVWDLSIKAHGYSHLVLDKEGQKRTLDKNLLQMGLGEQDILS